MQLLWSLLIVDPLIAISTIICGTISLVLVELDASGRKAFSIARFWARTLLAFPFVRVKVEGLEKIDPSKAYVFVCNHLSYMDTPAILANIPCEFRFLAKSELFKIPFMGHYLGRGGHIPVELEDPRASVRTLLHAAKVVQTKGYSLLIFPEGGRSETGVLQPFMDGAAFLAIRARIPLVPIALIGTREVLPMHGKKFTPGLVRLRIGDPLSTEGLTSADRAQLTATSRAKIVELLEMVESTR